MNTTRFCIVQDNSRHRWICPVEKREDVEASIRAVEEYWEDENAEGECPENLTDNLPGWEGEDLTFSNPCLDGNSLFEELDA